MHFSEIYIRLIIIMIIKMTHCYEKKILENVKICIISELWRS